MTFDEFHNSLRLLHSIDAIKKAWNTRASLPEATAGDAPCYYAADIAAAWANGYNACLALTRAPSTVWVEALTAETIPWKDEKRQFPLYELAPDFTLIDRDPQADERLKLYRDIFAEITAKAVPVYDPTSGDPERVSYYRLSVGPLHRAAGKLGFQLFDGERHLANAVAEIARLKAQIASPTLASEKEGGKIDGTSPRKGRGEMNPNQPIFDAITAATRIENDYGGQSTQAIIIDVAKFVETFNNHRDRKLCSALNANQSAELADYARDVTRLRAQLAMARSVIAGAVEAIERNSTSAPVLECLKAALTDENGK